MKKISFLDIALLFIIFIIFIVMGWQSNFKAQTTLYQKCDVGIVFGAGITKSGTPSPALQYRLDKAIELYKKNLLEKILISGKIHETLVMKNYLLYKGILLENIIIDINGINTAKTLKNVRNFQLKEELKTIAFISQKYHLARIFILAHKNKIKNFHLVSTDTKKLDKLEHFFLNLRETFAIFKSLIFE